MSANFKKLKEEWAVLDSETLNFPIFQQMAIGEFSLLHYRSLLRELYFLYRETPQILASATSHFQGLQRLNIKRFLQSAISHSGAEQLILSDLSALGENIGQIVSDHPLPTTTAFNAYAYHQIERVCPVAVLGYLIQLWYSPVHGKFRYLNCFQEAGIPSKALHFYTDLTSLDLDYEEDLKAFSSDLIISPKDLDATIRTMRDTSVLFSNLIENAFRSVDQKEMLLSATGEH